MQEVAIHNKVFVCPARGFGVFVRTVTTADSPAATRQWLYNRRSELVGASGTQPHPYDYAYSYDSIGNRLTSSGDFGAATYAANNLNQYTQVTTAQTPQDLAYDADGNLTQDERFTYAYDDENRLVSVTPRNPQVGSLAIENAYDHRSRRIRKVVKSYDGSSWNVTETRLFVWDEWNIVFEQITFSDNTTRTVEYFWGNDLSGSEQGAGGVGGLLATRIDGVFYIPVYGGNGNIMMYVDETGAIAAQFDYDPYGRALAAPNYWENLWNFAFSTKYHDWETDLIAYQLRTYNPAHGRWLNRDPIGEEGGENLFMFCMNTPSSQYDVWGLVCRIGTFNVLSLIVDAKPAANGLSYDPELFRKGESLLSSLDKLDYISAPSSLMTGSVLSRLISALDIAAGKVSSPNNNALEQIHRLFNKLKSGSIEIYGILEYEMCKCSVGKPKMIRQEPIKDSDEMVLDSTDRNTVRMGYKNVMGNLMEQLSAAIKAARGGK